MDSHKLIILTPLKLKLDPNSIEMVSHNILFNRSLSQELFNEIARVSASDSLLFSDDPRDTRVDEID